MSFGATILSDLFRSKEGVAERVYELALWVLVEPPRGLIFQGILTTDAPILALQGVDKALGGFRIADVQQKLEAALIVVKIFSEQREDLAVENGVEPLRRGRRIAILHLLLDERKGRGSPSGGGRSYRRKRDLRRVRQ